MSRKSRGRGASSSSRSAWWLLPEKDHPFECGNRCEPFELVDVELPEEYSGSVISMLGERNGNMLEMGYRS